MAPVLRDVKIADNHDSNTVQAAVNRMLFSLYPILTKHYFILCFVITLGILQWAAARNRKPALSFLGLWGLSWVGLICGGFLVGGGFIWFFTLTPGLFQSGLAGGELTILFSAGGLSGLAVARLLGAFWQNVDKISARPAVQQAFVKARSTLPAKVPEKRQITTRPDNL